MGAAPDVMIDDLRNIHRSPQKRAVRGLVMAHKSGYKAAQRQLFWKKKTIDHDTYLISVMDQFWGFMSGYQGPPLPPPLWGSFEVRRPIL